MAIATIEVRAVNVPMLENGSHAGQKKKNMSFFSNLCISIFSLSLLAVPTALAEKKEDEGYRVSIKLAVNWLQDLADETGNAIKNSTILLPTDTAFKELAEILELEDVQDLFGADEVIRDSAFHIIKYHIIPGNSLVVEALAEGKETVANTAIEEPVRLTKRGKSDVEVKGEGKRSSGKILKANINMEGHNIVHVLDTVLMPAGYDLYEDFYNTVTSTEIMEKLLEKTGASKVLGDGTIFAPVDAAFERLSKKMGLKSVEDLLDDKNVRTLADVLKYHVLPDVKVSAKEIRSDDGKSWGTANGRSLTAQLSDEGVLQVVSDDGASKANVVEEDKSYKDFVMHAISNVLLREELE